MNPGNQIWILLAFVALSFLQWLIRRLQEQSAINRKKQAEQRRRDEILRTGRDPDQQEGARSAEPASVSAEAAARQARLRELRQRQLEEMRRKGAPRPTPGTQARTPTPPPQRSGPIVIGGPTAPAPPRPPARQAPPTRQGRPPAPATPQRPPRPQPAPQRAQGKSPPSKRPAGSEAPPIPRRTSAAAVDEKSLRDTTTPRSLAATPLLDDAPQTSAARPSASVPAVGPGMKPAEWRRAIIFSEIFAPPVSMREEP